jgi:hypothetical protein
MITELVTFFGAQGQRHAELLFIASCITAPFAVDFFKEETCFMTKFFSTEEEAEAAATQYAFDGFVPELY